MFPSGIPPFDDDVPEPQLLILNPPSQRLFAAPNGFSVVPYEEYFHEIMCFTTDGTPSAQETIRNYMRTVCLRENSKLHMGTLQIPREGIPQGTWTAGFAPSILQHGAWVVIFAAPQDSQTVWYFWPEKGVSEATVFELLKQMREQGRIKATEPMATGGKRHREFHAMVEQAVWAQQNLMQVDLGTGEFRTVG